jgi:hypothetical protein
MDLVSAEERSRGFEPSHATQNPKKLILQSTERLGGSAFKKIGEYLQSPEIRVLWRAPQNSRDRGLNNTGTSSVRV